MQILFPNDHGRAQRGRPGSPRQCLHSTAAGTVSFYEKPHVPYPTSAFLNSGWLLAENRAWPRTLNQALPINICTFATFSIWYKTICNFPSLASKRGLSPSQGRNKLLIDGTISQEQESKQQENKKWSWFEFLPHNDPNYTIYHIICIATTQPFISAWVASHLISAYL